MAAATKGGFVALFKRGWHEIPEIIGSGFMFLVGVGLASGGLYNYFRKDGNNRKFKVQYTVIRHDDPKVSTIRTGIDG